MRQFFIPLVMGICITMISPSAVWATCPSEVDLEQSTMQSDVVAYGKVVALTPVGESHWDAEIEVQRAYKGKPRAGSTITVRSSQSEHEEVDFQVDRAVMVYASKGESGKLETTRCLGSKSMKEAPLVAETASFFAIPPGNARLEIKARRASAVFVGEVTAAGHGYAGRWDGVMLDVKVTDGIKGVKRNAKLKIRLDEDSCGDGKKLNLLSDDDLLAGDARAPYEVKKRYLFYTFDESPHQVLLCHENMQPEGAAREDLGLLKTMCKKGRCQSGHDEVGKMRLGVKQKVEQYTKTSLQRCAAELPLFGSKGSITDLTLKVRVRPGGKVDLLNVASRGTLEEGLLYDALGQCMERELGEWAFDAVEGRPELEAAVTLQMKEGKGPRYEYSEVIMSER